MVRLASHNFSSQPSRRFQHCVNIIDFGQIDKRYRFIGKQRCGNHRQRSIFISGYAMRSGYLISPSNY
jgi:hypothetical protein